MHILGEGCSCDDRMVDFRKVRGFCFDWRGEGVSEWCHLKLDPRSRWCPGARISLDGDQRYWTNHPNVCQANVSIETIENADKGRGSMISFLFVTLDPRFIQGGP